MKKLILFIFIFSFLSELKADSFFSELIKGIKEGFQEGIETVKRPMQDQLFRTVANGDLEAFKKLFFGDINQKSKTYQGRTLLHVASESGYSHIVNYLITRGADVNQKDNYGETPLHDAADEGHSEVVEILIKRKSQVNMQSRLGDTPLHLAAEKNRPEVAEILIKNGANISLKNISGNKPIDMVSAEYSSKINQIFTKYEINDDQYKKTKKFMEKMIRKKERLYIIDGFGQSPLHIFAKKGDLTAVKQSIEEVGTHVNLQDQWGQTALHIASENNQSEIAKVLIKAGINFNAQDKEGNTALITSIINENFDVFKVLLKFANPNTSILNHRGENAYRLLQRANRPEELKLLEDIITKKIKEAKKNSLKKSAGSRARVRGK